MMKRTIFLTWAILCLGLSSQTFGSTYTVNIGFDGFNLSDQKLTLREAIYLANNNPGPDIIQLASGTVYTLTLDGGENPLSPAEIGDLDVYESTISIVGDTVSPPLIKFDRKGQYFEKSARGAMHLNGHLRN